MIYQGIKDNPGWEDIVLATEQKLRERIASGELEPRRRAVKGGWMLKAAGVLFLVAMGLLGWRTVFTAGPSTDDRVTELLQESYEQTLLRRGTISNSTREASSRFHRALNNLYDGRNLELSIREFGVLEKSDSTYGQEARWFLSLALWKNGDSIGAKDYWQRISNTQGHYMQEAAKELLTGAYKL